MTSKQEQLAWDEQRLWAISEKLHNQRIELEQRCYECQDKHYAASRNIKKKLATA